tara:strand:+ start:2177 stop:2554 length:378 start_codon:yes stop_codon:yes gene_type:complete
MSRDNETKQVKVDITFEQFNDVIVTALEGGSNYWYLIHDEHIPTGVWGSRIDRVVEKLWDDPEYVLPIYDVEDESELLGELTMQKFLDNIGKHESAFADLLNDNLDGYSADMLFQMAVMGEVVYG